MSRRVPGDGSKEDSGRPLDPEESRSHRTNGPRPQVRRHLSSSGPLPQRDGELVGARTEETMYTTKTLGPSSDLICDDHTDITDDKKLIHLQRNNVLTAHRVSFSGKRWSINEGFLSRVTSDSSFVGGWSLGNPARGPSLPVSITPPESSSPT